MLANSNYILLYTITSLQEYMLFTLVIQDLIDPTWIDLQYLNQNTTLLLTSNEKFVSEFCISDKQQIKSNCFTLNNNISFIINNTYTLRFHYSNKQQYIVIQKQLSPHEKPLISVNIPIFNGYNDIISCLNSVKQQTYQNYEVICVDDGSTDQSINQLINYINEFQQAFKIIKQLTNKGLLSTRITGVREASAKYIFNLDVDDILPNKESFQKGIDEAVYNSYPDQLQFQSKIYEKFQISQFIQASPFTIGLYDGNVNKLYKGSQYQINKLQIFIWGMFIKREKYLEAIEYFKDFAQTKVNMYEDILQRHYINHVCQTYYGIDIVGYQYNIKQNSITHKISDQEKLNSILYINEHIRQNIGLITSKTSRHIAKHYRNIINSDNATNIELANQLMKKYQVALKGRAVIYKSKKQTSQKVVKSQQNIKNVP